MLITDRVATARCTDPIQVRVTVMQRLKQQIHGRCGVRFDNGPGANRIHA